jgi:hypothetical protein
MRCVVIESPYAGNIEKNLTYLRACMKDCLLRGEAPYASHGLYTQEGVLDDTIPEERRMGMEAGFAMNLKMDATVVYNDLGISDGMKEGMLRASQENRPVEIRSLNDWKKKKDYIKQPKLLSREQAIERLMDANKSSEKFFEYAHGLEREDGMYEEGLVNRYIAR